MGANFPISRKRSSFTHDKQVLGTQTFRVRNANDFMMRYSHIKTG